MLNFWDSLLLFLDGKKAYISAITLLVVPFLVSQNLLTNEWAQLIMGIVAILMGGGKFITDQATDTIGTRKESELGRAIVSKRNE